VIGCVVDGVDTDGIDAQFLELDDITLAAVGIGNGVGQIGGATRLVVNATDVESVIAGEECCKNVSV
jgi:hypothetical protein